MSASAVAHASARTGEHIGALGGPGPGERLWETGTG